MNFYEFMKASCVGQDDPVGDLAGDLMHDKDFDRSLHSADKIRKYFYNLLGEEFGGYGFTISCGVLEAVETAIRDWQKTLGLEDPEHPKGYCFDSHQDSLDIWWGGYEYWIQCDRLDTPEKFLTWIIHLTEKNWEGMTPRKIGLLTGDLDRRFHWNLPFGC